mmetsp:Transcript_2732/g.5883  ORF Transcript_2732/g.5883 Transcript_2732/m.5883 type:complete len:229 (-) Transcript_2732:62-748(-)
MPGARSLQGHPPEQVLVLRPASRVARSATQTPRGPPRHCAPPRLGRAQQHSASARSSELRSNASCHRKHAIPPHPQGPGCFRRRPSAVREKNASIEQGARTLPYLSRCDPPCLKESFAPSVPRVPCDVRSRGRNFLSTHWRRSRCSTSEPPGCRIRHPQMASLPSPQVLTPWSLPHPAAASASGACPRSVSWMVAMASPLPSVPMTSAAVAYLALPISWMPCGRWRRE